MKYNKRVCSFRFFLKWNLSCFLSFLFTSSFYFSSSHFFPLCVFTLLTSAYLFIAVSFILSTSFYYLEEKISCVFLIFFCLGYIFLSFILEAGVSLSNQRQELLPNWSSFNWISYFSLELFKERGKLHSIKSHLDPTHPNQRPAELD